MHHGDENKLQRLDQVGLSASTDWPNRKIEFKKFSSWEVEMPMLKKLPKAQRARIQNAAADLERAYGDKACDVARETSKKARKKHQPATARYWSLISIAISKNNAS